MSTLYLVRHAQASFLESDYDRLSELGHEQARRLGEHWKAHGLRLDTVYSGPRRRQIHTAELVLEAMSATPGEIVVLEELDEYRADEIGRAYLPELVGRHAELAQLLAQAGADQPRELRTRAIDRVLRRVLESWMRDEIVVDAIESFAVFRARIERALSRITTGEARGRQVAAFSSGGAIGCLIASLLRADAMAALELGFNVHNAGVTEIVWSGERKSLRAFNTLSHLPDPATWTFR